MPRRMVMARKGFWGKEAWLLRPLLLCTQQWNKLRPFGIALGIRCFYYFKHMGMPSSRWSVGILQVWTSQAHDPNRSHAFSRSKGLVVCSNMLYFLLYLFLLLNFFLYAHQLLFFSCGVKVVQLPV
ncbi:hypothetical protein PVAP13_9KG406401 [Panicum virgatum]|uniref:Uncharacterized protein n=1 Tax=Panicum virgatum TaxID=38727 RepID=A0A8T0NQA0_PANVG|nr:hypothetical protein PVAP13_9KG406401 [Panicum virgatum]